MASELGLSSPPPTSTVTEAKPASVPTLVPVQEIPLVSKGNRHLRPRGRLDHFTHDPVAKRIFLACLGDNSVFIVDAYGGCVESVIYDDDENDPEYISCPQGLLCLPKTDRKPGLLYVANAGSGTLSAVECSYSSSGQDLNCESSQGFRGWVCGKEDADNLRCLDGKVYLGYGEGSIGVFDLTDDERGGLGGETLLCQCRGHPESFQLEPPATPRPLDPGATATEGSGGGEAAAASPQAPGSGSHVMPPPSSSCSRVFVNVADKRHVAVFDRASGAALAEWPLPDGLSGNFAMCLDPEVGTLPLDPEEGTLPCATTPR